MRIHASVEFKLQTKDVSQAVGHALQTLQANVANQESVELEMTVHTGSNAGVVLHLANLLPAEVMGFDANFTQRKSTAAEFLAMIPLLGKKPMVSFNGKLTDSLSFEKSVEIIRSLLTCKPAALRSASIDLNCKKIRWTGAPEDSAGSFLLWDSKGRSAKYRFSCQAFMELSGKNAADPAVQADLKAVSQKTGFDFAGAHLKVQHESSTPLTFHDLLIGEVCFREAFARASISIRERRLNWTQMPGVGTDEECLKGRMEDWGSESDRVNFHSVARKIFKQDMPEFTLRNSKIPQLGFSRLLTENLKLIVVFETDFGSLGKEFTIQIGVEATGARHAGKEWRAQCFQFLGFQRRSGPHWVYSNRSQLDVALRGAIPFLRELLTAFEPAAVSFMAPIPHDLPDSISSRGAITARQRLDEAWVLARHWSADASLYRVSISSLFAFGSAGKIFPDRFPSELDLNGRLKPDGAWLYRFYSARKRECFVAEVPVLGAIQFGIDPIHDNANFNERNYLALADDWMDSDRVLSLTEKHGGQEMRKRAATFFGVYCELRVDPCTSTRGRWSVRYDIVDSRGGDRLKISFDSIDGGDLLLDRQ